MEYIGAYIYYKLRSLFFFVARVDLLAHTKCAPSFPMYTRSRRKQQRPAAAEEEVAWCITRIGRWRPGPR